MADDREVHADTGRAMTCRYGGGVVVSLFAFLIAACGGNPSSPNTPSCTFRVTLQNASFGPAGGPGSATVSAASGCAWAAASTADWISIGSAATPTGDGRVDFTVAAYGGSVERSGAIVVAKETLTIAQQACAIQLAPAEETFSDAAGSRDVEVQTQEGCRWAFEAAPAWITLTPGSGTGPAHVTVRVTENSQTSARDMTLHAGSATLTVQQAGALAPPVPPPPPTPAACSFGVDRAQIYPHSYGESAAVTVSAPPGCAWTVSTAAPWIHLNTAGGTGSGSITMTFDANPQSYVTDFRQGVVEVRWPSPTAGQNVQVSQFGNCSTAFAFAPGGPISRDNTLSFGADGGTARVFVLTDSPFNCPWWVESQPSPFAVTFPAIQAIQRGDGEVLVTAPSNPSSQPRTATVVIGEKALTIAQAGR